ncbi:MAG: hypothetical protein NT075_25365 [Chloroflexi bacterium]|nr:hypothetical protein [Chloroflexota bacterium]
MPNHTQIAYLVDDQQGRPTGVRVVEPPADTRQAMRGKLYAIVDLFGDNPDRVTFAERLLSVIQRTYYTLKGSQSVVLAEALHEAMHTLQTFNEQSAEAPLEGGIMIAALLGERLLLIGNGPALALIRAGTGVDIYPPFSAGDARPADDAAAGAPEIYRHTLDTNGAFFIGTNRWLQRLPLRQLAGTIAYLDQENYIDAAGGLRELSEGFELPGLLVLLTPSSNAIASPSTLSPPLLRRGRASGLPTAVNAQSPVHNAPTANPPAQLDRQPAISVFDSPAQSPHLQNSGTEITSGALGSESAYPLAIHQPTWQNRLSANVGESAKVGLQRAKELIVNLLPERFNAGPVSQRNPAATSYDLAPLTPAPLSTALATAVEVEPAQDERFAAMHSEASIGAMSSQDPVAEAPASIESAAIVLPPRAQGSRVRLFILLAVLILALVPVVVAGVYWQQGATNRAEAESLLNLADARFTSARQAFDTGDKVVARTQLTEALEHIEAATKLQGRSARASDLSARINTQLEKVLQVQPLYGLAAPLVKFPSDAQPRRVIVADQDIYVLDVGRQLVQHFLYDSKNNTVADPEGEIILRQGELHNGATVDRLVDIAWQPPVPGIDDKANLLILDRQNHIFRFNRLEGVTTLKFADQTGWKTPTQLETFGGRLYIADEGAGQLFRYTSGNYGVAPESWFAPETTVNLAGLQSMSIDGDIWLLFSDGRILRYHAGEQEPFTLENSVGLADEPVDMIVGDQGDSSIYLADSGQERILVFDKQGKYLRQLKAAEGNPLRGLSGLFVNEVTSSLFMLTQSALYEQALPNGLNN